MHTSRPTIRRRTTPARAVAVALAGAALVATALSGCAATSGGADAKRASDVSRVTITLANDGDADTCTLDHATAAAGPITFTVKNESATGITEVELQSHERILGEKENLAPGLAPVTFTVTLGGGTYQVYCPGAVKETQTFTVTGKAAAKPAGSVQTLLQQGASDYATYVDTQVAGMVEAVGRLDDAVQAGDVAAAQKAYAAARPFYERIETDVDGFVLPGHDATDNAGNLDYLVDMRASNLDDAVGWHGFHAVERDLFQAGAITATTRQLSSELKTNVGRLDSLVKTLEFKPEDLANGAAGLLEEVQANKIKGEEEAYSHIDLVDFAANVEGAQQSFAFLEPGLKKIDSGLVATISTQFDRVRTMLDGYRDPAALGGYAAYTAELKASDANRLSQAVQALQDPLSRIAEKVATAR
ncbi:EfeM/EfeO family lipoprotein [Microbacterium sp. STN6]|uniref:iron uptake system protein EfeO n=1 Tax=Microbacterium sp. STN6 TaxID=2995588 RepID=UPI0022609E3A|nr:iron uptake system protein EfeO [Microbacterium sp. STN6]MCX7521913.1 EfeM/EfeO family lipoprotein [Microbacterium sp. STN6]